MAHGMEGPFKSADAKLIRQEESQKPRAEVLISAESALAETIVNNTNLVSVLNGEELFASIQQQPDANKQLSWATMILRNTPFIIKYLPPHVTEEDHRSALIVGIAKSLKESAQRMN